MIRRMMVAVMMVVMGLMVMGQGVAATRGGGGADRVDAAKLLAPYVDSQTLAVGHADMSKIDTGAIFKYLSDFMDYAKIPEESRGEVRAVRLAADTFLARFKMLGGRHVFVLLSHPDLWPNLQPLAVLLKVEPVDVTAVDMEAFIKSLIPGGGGGGPGELVTAKMPDGLIFVGHAAALERLKTLKPEPRPDLNLEALGQSGAGGGAAVDFFAAPSPDVRRALSELMPTLPAEVGGASTASLVKGLRSVRVLISPPPEPAASITFTFFDDQRRGPGVSINDGVVAAQTLERMITLLRDEMLADPNLGKMLDSPAMKPMADEVRALIKEVLTPVVPGGGGFGGAAFIGQMSLQLNAKQILTLTHLMAPALSSARGQSERIRSISNIRQIVVGCLMYANDHNGTLPESLKVLVDANLIKADLLVIPGNPQGAGYVYRRWVPELSKVSNASITPLVWESTVESPEGVAVGFVDGHAELIRDRKTFEELMKQTEEWAKGVKDK